MHIIPKNEVYNCPYCGQVFRIPDESKMIIICCSECGYSFYVENEKPRLKKINNKE